MNKEMENEYLKEMQIKSELRSSTKAMCKQALVTSFELREAINSSNEISDFDLANIRATAKELIEDVEKVIKYRDQLKIDSAKEKHGKVSVVY